MATTKCDGTKVIGQTLFLGASVVSVNMNLGWGGTSSTCTVELVEDFQPITCYNGSRPIDPFRNPSSYADDHYHTCASDETCYIDELGNPYNPNRLDNDGDPNPPKEKNVPGKIYYTWTANGLVSKYWFAEDPGFFATGTKINNVGGIDATNTNVYDIIGIAVFFKFDNMTFTGIVKGWERNFRNGRNFFKVEIESAGSLLENSHIILDQYAGTVFSMAPGDTYGAPRNYVGSLDATANIKSGNLHNTFNVYGFLDSLGPAGFGGANKNDKGISYRLALQTLKVLTSSTDKNQLKWQSKNMFSPFGRILSKVMQKVDNAGYINIEPSFQNNAFGVIPPILDDNSIPRTEFTLDLSEIEIPPDDFRVEAKGGILRISDFLNQMLELNGQQNYWVFAESLVQNGSPHNILKVKAVPKENYIKPYTINYVVNELVNNGYAATSSSSGQRKNKEANVRTVMIGGKQKRIFQVKNYRLAFNQDNYIWNPVTAEFINFRRFDDIVTDKYKAPIATSTRNPQLGDQIHGNYNSIIDTDEKVRKFITGNSFTDPNNLWVDDTVFSRDTSCLDVYSNKDFAIDENTGLPIVDNITDADKLPGVGLAGNIGNNVVGFTAVGSPLTLLGVFKQAEPQATPSSSIGQLFSSTLGVALFGSLGTLEVSGSEEIITDIDQSNRYIPIFKDSICPFFGFKYDRTYPVSQDSNMHNYIRPVWLDSWTGQLCIAFDINELPPVSCGPLVSVYDKAFFGKDSGALPGTDKGMNQDPDDLASGGDSSGNPETIPPTGIPPTQPDITPELKREINFKGTGFLVTESELRAAMSGWESYLKYCLAKMPSTKPDLFLMLLECWQDKGVQISSGVVSNKKGLTRSPSELAAHGNDNNVANAGGAPGKRKGAQKSKISDINFSMLMHPGFINDLKILTNFLSTLASKYYGKKYMVKIPYMQSYRDQAYSNFNIPGFRGGDLFVYSGSAKTFSEYSLARSAWEEPGNYIDDGVIVGGAYWSALTDEQGMIPPLLGFNVSDKVDYTKKAWCALSALEKAEKLSKLRTQAVTEVFEDLAVLEQVQFVRKPFVGPLSNWSFRIVCPQMKDNGSGGEAPNPILTCALNGYLELTGNETDDFLKQSIVGMDEETFKGFKKFQALKRQAAAVTADMPAAIECTAEEALEQDNANLNATAKVFVNEDSFLIPSIKWSTAGDSKEHVVVPYNVGFVSAYGADADPCAGGKKLYKKASIDNNAKIAYGRPEFLSDPRAIISIGNRIELNTTTYAYEHDPNGYVMPNVASEDISFYRYATGAARRYRIDKNGEAVLVGNGFDLTQDEYDHMEYLESNFLTPVIREGNLLEKGSKTNVSANHRKMAAKAAQPFFAAIPVESNRYVYGPWANYPDLNKNNIWSYVDNPDTIVENLVDNITVEHNNDYVPWNYGGTSLLDKAVIWDISAKENYLTTEENGSVKILGPPIFTIGSQFSTSANTLVSPYSIDTESIKMQDYDTQGGFVNQDFNCIFLDQSSTYNQGYPFVQGINISVATEGVTTSYNIGSYNPKMGSYNKELSDAQKNINQRFLKLGNEVLTNQNSSTNQLAEEVLSIIENQTNTTDVLKEAADLYSDSMFGNSPGELLIGSSRHFIAASNNGSDASGMIRNKQMESWAGLFMAEEVGPELLQGYNVKSAMSLDGLLSPVSFYATPYHSTHNLSNFTTAQTRLATLESGNIPAVLDGYATKAYCHICKNVGYIEDTFVNYPNSEDRKTVKYACPNCNASRVSYDKFLDEKPTKDKAPRVVLNSDPKSKDIGINFYSLNPVVVPRGEFANPNAYPSGNVPATHSIRVVGRGQQLPGIEANLDNFHGRNTQSSTIPPAFEEFDFESKEAEGTLFLNNQRFFSLRGPLMVHGWGYDKDGYPTPNYSDEPLEIDEDGRPKRFRLDGKGFNDMTHPGAFEPIKKEDNPFFFLHLGDIITKRYSWDGSQWVMSKKPSKYFSENWASKPDTWPVGPVDLRWDHERRVWVGGDGGCGEELLPPYIVTNKIDNSTLADYISEKTDSGCPYKMVYVTLEQDLVRSPDVFFYTNAVRGYIDDLEYITEPLPNGFRRLVYVIDRAGYSAPAGVRLLCRYNPDLGYYEPISKPNIVALGVINNGEANIETAYAKSKTGAVSSDLVVNFNNPLDFQVYSGAPGVFSFIDGSWTLTSMN